MKRWPLRWKIAAYAAVLGIVATLAGAGTTWFLIRYLETTRVGAVPSEANRIGIEILLGMVGALPTVLIVVLLGGRLVANRALTPIKEICDAAERITAKSLDHRLPMPAAGDEISDLITVLNRTFERLQRSFEQCVRFSSEASHHLKTPISVLRAGIEEILTDPATPPKQQNRADALLHQTHQLTAIAEDLLLLARADAGRLDLSRMEFSLTEVLEGVCDDARVLGEHHGLTVETAISPRLSLVGDRGSIAMVVQNLIENAVKHNVPGGRVCIDAHSNNGEIEVLVRNNAEPIPPARLPHIFERFYRARPDGRNPGPGLGLSVASELTKAHGGSLEVLRSDATWTEFRLSLPSGAAPAHSA